MAIWLYVIYYIQANTQVAVQIRNICLRIGHISLLSVLRGNVLINLLQDELNGLLKVGDVAHLELGPIAEEGDHVTVAEQALGRAELNDVGVHDLGHVLPTDARGNADPAGGDLVPDPGLPGPGGRGGDDAHDGKDRYGGDNGLSDGGRALVEGLLRSQSSGTFASGLGLIGNSPLALSPLGLLWQY